MNSVLTFQNPTKTITQPETKPLLLISGAPESGKLSVAKSLSDFIQGLAEMDVKGKSNLQEREINLLSPNEFNNGQFREQASSLHDVDVDLNIGFTKPENIATIKQNYNGPVYTALLKASRVGDIPNDQLVSLKEANAASRKSNSAEDRYKMHLFGQEDEKIAKTRMLRRGIENNDTRAVDQRNIDEQIKNHMAPDIARLNKLLENGDVSYIIQNPDANPYIEKSSMNIVLNQIDEIIGQILPENNIVNFEIASRKEASLV